MRNISSSLYIRYGHWHFKGKDFASGLTSLLVLVLVLCKIARALNSTAISKYVTLKMTDDVPSKHVWKIKESDYVYTTIYIVC